MGGKRMDLFERQTIKVNRRFARIVGDEYAQKALIAAKKGRPTVQL
jgi:hypothetical protein